MKRTKGFTLLELVVSVGIISMMTAILVPALGGARESARQTLCRQNEHGMGMGLLMYCSDNNDIVAPHEWPGPIEQWAPIWWWADFMVKYFDQDAKPWWNQSPYYRKAPGSQAEWRYSVAVQPDNDYVAGMKYAYEIPGWDPADPPIVKFSKRMKCPSVVNPTSSWNMHYTYLMTWQSNPRSITRIGAWDSLERQNAPTWPAQPMRYFEFANPANYCQILDRGPQDERWGQVYEFWAPGYGGTGTIGNMPRTLGMCAPHNMINGRPGTGESDGIFMDGHVEAVPAQTMLNVASYVKARGYPLFDQNDSNLLPFWNVGGRVVYPNQW